MNIKEVILKIRKKIKENKFLSSLCIFGMCAILICSGVIVSLTNLVISIVLILLGSIIIVDLVYKMECEHDN